MAVLIALTPIFSLPGIIAGFRPVYLHFFVVGWLTQLIFGVMHWMFPKASSDHPRGNEKLIWFAFICLNLGLVARGLAEPFNAIQPSPVWPWFLVASAILQWLAALAFVLNTWPRVRRR